VIHRTDEEERDEADGVVEPVGEDRCPDAAVAVPQHAERDGVQGDDHDTSKGLSISAARIAASTASAESPRAAPWSIARTVSSRMMERDGVLGRRWPSTPWSGPRRTAALLRQGYENSVTLEIRWS
jgi:hypothetical protein